MIKFFVSICSVFFILSCGTKLAKDSPSIKEKETKILIAKVNENIVSEVPVSPSRPTTSDVKQAELDQAVIAGDDEKIRNISVELLQINSKNYNALNSLAMFHYKKQQFEAAMLLLNRALESNSKSSEVYNNYGLIMLAKNEKKEAVNMFRKALQLDSKNYLAAANVASIYAKEKDYNKVIFVLESFSKNDKLDIKSLNNYAIALVATGKDKKAAEIYRKILKDNPDYNEVMLNYSILMIERQGKYKEGLDLISRLKFVELDNESRQLIKDLENRAKAGLK